MVGSFRLEIIQVEDGATVRKACHADHSAATSAPAKRVLQPGRQGEMTEIIDADLSLEAVLRQQTGGKLMTPALLTRMSITPA